MDSPFAVAARPSRLPLAPGVLVVALLLGCGAWRDYAMNLRNDTSRDVTASAEFKGGNGDLILPPGASTRVSSQDPFVVTVTLPDGARRVVTVRSPDRTDIRIVEGQQPFTVYVNGR